MEDEEEEEDEEDEEEEEDEEDEEEGSVGGKRKEILENRKRVVIKSYSVLLRVVKSYSYSYCKEKQNR